MGRRAPAALCAAALALVAGLLWSGGVAAAQAAQEHAAPTWLDVEKVPYDAVRVVVRALHQHAGVRIAQLQLQAAQARVVESRAALRPALSVDIRPYWLESLAPDYTRLTDLFSDLNPDALNDPSRWPDLTAELGERFQEAGELLNEGLPEKWYEGDGYTITLTGRVPLWKSPLQGALETVASIDATQAQADFENAVGAAIVQSLEAYYGVLRAQAALRVAEEALAEVRLRAVEVEARRAQGTATELDELQVQSELHQAEARVIEARGELAAAHMGLNQVLGLPPETRLHVVETQLPAAWPSLDEALRLIERRGDVRRAKSDLEKAQAAVVVAREQAAAGVRVFGQYRWPEVELSFGIDRHGYLGGTVTHNRLNMDLEQPFGSQESEGWTAGIEISWPLFDGHERRAKVAQAELQAEQAALGAEQVYKAAVTEVTAAFARLQAAEQALAGAKRGVEAAQEAVRVAEALALAGAATAHDVARARLGLAQAEMGRLEATYAFTLAQTAYLQAAGVLLPHWLALVGLDGSGLDVLGL